MYLFNFRGLDDASEAKGRTNHFKSAICQQMYFFKGGGSARVEGLPLPNVQLVMAYGVAIIA